MFLSSLCSAFFTMGKGTVCVVMTVCCVLIDYTIPFTSGLPSLCSQSVASNIFFPGTENMLWTEYFTITLLSNAKFRRLFLGASLFSERCLCCDKAFRPDVYLLLHISMRRVFFPDALCAGEAVTVTVKALTSLCKGQQGIKNVPKMKKVT